MNEKRIIVLVDDMFSSADDFWSVHSATRDLFEEKYDLRVFDYRPEENFRTEYPRIKEFLEAASGTAQIALLDVQFPDAPRGGLQILRYLKRRELDIPLILVVSASHDQGLAMELAGLPFVHRHESLDLQAITRRLDELFSTESLDHPERGILITHGTDTLSYVVEFLRYGVRDPGRTNIIVTGSQIPMGEGGAASDAIDNVRSGILLLQHLYAPQVGVVFNRGEQFFRSNIQKISKWHPMAFGGTCDVDLDWDQFKANDPSILLRHAPPPLKDLVLLRTGGTIESVHVEGRGYIPGADSVSEFITGNLARHYNRFSAIPFTSLDSSNMTFSDWVRLLELLQKECDIGVDTGFEPRIGLITPSPFLTTDDYSSWINRFEGVVIAGYGAGNANILESSGFSLLNAVREYARERPVVLASHVPHELTDFAYEVGRMFVEAGCIPAGHLAFPACQVRLSYLLGHRNQLNLNTVDRIREAFVHGLSFRTEGSLHVCEEIFNKARLAHGLAALESDGFEILDHDPLLCRRHLARE